MPEISRFYGIIPVLIFEHFRPERLDMEGGSATCVGERLFVGIALPDDDAFESDRVRDIPIGVLLYDDLDQLRHLRPRLWTTTLRGPGWTRMFTSVQAR